METGFRLWGKGGACGGGIRAKDSVSGTWTAVGTDSEAQWWRPRSLAIGDVPINGGLSSFINAPRHSQSICQFSNPLRLESPHPTCVQPLSSRCRVTFQGACAKWSRCREEQPRPLGPGKCLAHSLVSLLFQLEGSHLTCL